MLGVRTKAGTKCPCFFLSLFTGAPLASLSSFSSLLSSSPPSFHSSPPSSSEEGPSLNMGATEAEFGRTSEMSLKKASDCLFVCIVVVVVVLFFFFILFW